MKKILIACVITVLLVAVAIGLGWDKHIVSANGESEACCSKKERSNDELRLADVPEFVPYMFMFQHLSAVKDSKWQLDQLKVKGGFTSDEFGKLVKAAERYQDEVSEYDAQAKVIIDEFHRQYPPGKLPEGTGPGDPPQELLDLQKRRDDAALIHRDELKAELDAGLHREDKLKNFVEREFAPKIRKEPVEQSLYPQEVQ